MRIEEVQPHTPFIITDYWSSDLPLQFALARQFEQSSVGQSGWSTLSKHLEEFSKRVSERARPLSELCERPGSHPRLLQHDEWGRRVDRIETSEGWRGLLDFQVDERIVAAAYPNRSGENSEKTLGGRTRLGETARLYSFARAFIFSPDCQVSLCPTSMTDGAVRVLELFGTDKQRTRYLPKLLSTDPKTAWYSGQWMTEVAGGSDVSMTETTARRLGDPKTPSQAGDIYAVSGFKWFSSASDGRMALALARTDPDRLKGSKGLSLFLIPLRKEDRPALPANSNWKDETAPTSPYNGLKIHRLKNKFGTCMVPTAELELCGAVAELIGQEGRGVAQIASVLNITRLYSASGSVSSIGRSLHILQSYSSLRRVGSNGAPTLLKNLALHNTLVAKVAVNYRALLQLLWTVTRLLGKSEAKTSTTREERRLRLLTPVTKAFAAVRANNMIAQCIEGLGGQGYQAENPISTIYRDQLVETIWEGTPSVLSLDVARVHAQTRGQAVQEWAEDCLQSLHQSKTKFQNLKEGTLAEYVSRTLSDTISEMRAIFIVNKSLQSPTDDQRQARCLLDLIAIVECGCQLLAQAAWSTSTSLRHDEPSLEIQTAAKWIFSDSDLAKTRQSLQNIASNRWPASLEYRLAHAHDFPTKL